MFENLKFGITGFKTCVSENLCISCSCILLIFFNAWRILCKNWAVFLKTVFFFLEFRSIKAIFRSIKIDSKFLTEPLSILIDRT